MKSAPATKSSESAGSHGHYIKDSRQRRVLAALLAGDRLASELDLIEGDGRGAEVVCDLRRLGLAIKTEATPHRRRNGGTDRLFTFTGDRDKARDMLREPIRLIGIAEILDMPSDPGVIPARVLSTKGLPIGGQGDNIHKPPTKTPVYSQEFNLHYKRYRVTFYAAIAAGRASSIWLSWQPCAPSEELFFKLSDLYWEAFNEFIASLKRAGEKRGLVCTTTVGWERKNDQCFVRDEWGQS